MVKNIFSPQLVMDSVRMVEAATLTQLAYVNASE